jgi:hypothetical protein
VERLSEIPKQHEHSSPEASRARDVSSTATPLSPFLELQQQAGNQAVQQLLRSGFIQAKLAISNPDDPQEREADQVAHIIMRAHAFPASMPCSCSADGDICEECQRKQSQTTIHRSASGPPSSFVSAQVRRIVSDVLRSTGRPLDASTRAFFEPRFDRDFSHVRIHTDPQAAAIAQSIRAHAFTAGSHIAFAPNQYAPDTTPGRTLLAHELTHVTQKLDSETLYRAPSQGPGSKITRIDFWKPRRAVIFLDDGTNYTAGVVDDCDPAAGSYTVRADQRGDQVEFTPLTKVPPCKKKSANYLRIQDEGPGTIESGSTIEISIISPEISKLFTTGTSPVGVHLDADARSRIASLLQSAGFDQEEWFDFLSYNGGHPANAEEFIKALELFIKRKRKSEETSRKETENLQKGLKASMVSRGSGVSDDMLDVFKDYQQYRKLQKIRSSGGFAGGQQLKQFVESYPEAKEPIGLFGFGVDNYSQQLMNRIQTKLSAFGISDTDDFDKHIATFADYFRDATLDLAFRFLGDAYRICDRYLRQVKRAEFTNSWNEKAKSMLATLDKIREPVTQKVESAEKKAQKAAIREALARTTFHHDEEAASQAAAEKESAEAEKELALSKVPKALDEFPFVAWPDFPRERLLGETDPKEIMYFVDWYLIEHRKAITDTMEQLRSDPDRIYKMDVLLNIAKQNFGIKDGSIFDLIIREEIEKASEESLLDRMKSVLLFVLIVASIAVPGAVGLGATVGTTLLSADQASSLLDQYYQQSAAYKANLSSLEPSKFWVVVTIIGAGMDAQQAIELMVESVPLRKAIEEFTRSGDASRLSKALEGVPGLSTQSREAIEKQAEKRSVGAAAEPTEVPVAPDRVPETPSPKEATSAPGPGTSAEIGKSPRGLSESDSDRAFLKTTKKAALSPSEVERELEIVDRLPKQKSTDSEFAEEVHLSNEHDWKMKESGAACRFTEPTCFVHGRPGTLSWAPEGWPIEFVDPANLPDIVPNGVVLEFPNAERVWRRSGEDPATFAESRLGSAKGRKGHEKNLAPRSEMGPEYAESDLERAHSQGQGTGFESPYAIRYAPKEINQVLQNAGIEMYLRWLSQHKIPGVEYRLITETAVHPGSLRMQYIRYQVEAVTEKESAMLFSVKLNVEDKIQNPNVWIDDVELGTHPDLVEWLQTPELPDAIRDRLALLFKRRRRR